MTLTFVQVSVTLLRPRNIQYTSVLPIQTAYFTVVCWEAGCIYEVIKQE